VYFVPPQIYFRRGRTAARMARTAVRLLAILPFEAEAYRSAGADVVFIGHPAVDAAQEDAGSAGRLREEWAEVVGPDVAARSTPVALSAGVLSIKADGAAWASELTLLARSIVEKVDSYLGGGVVREVRVSAGPPLR